MSFSSDDGELVPSFTSGVFVGVPFYMACEDEDLRQAWRDAEADATQALHAWTQSESAARHDRFCAYQAALDREEQAAAVIAKFRGPGRRSRW